MAEAKVKVVEIPEEQAIALEDQLEEEEWESDWGAVFWASLILIVVLCGIGVAAWQPWAVV